MDTLLAALRSAAGLILSPTGELVGIVSLTFAVSGAALLLSAAAGVPLGALVGLKRFPLRGVIISGLNAFMGLPPVVVGLFIYIMLSRSGPLGFMGLLYSPPAMVAAQFVLALPIVAALTHSAVVNVEPAVRLSARTLGATHWQETLLVINEARYGIMSAVIAAFGRVMAEVGAVLMVGGNIAGYTRVMTTTIALETDKGDFSLALALGIILLAISVAINAALHAAQRRGKREA
ncbi:MAG: ABC transporter permease [Thermodesulfovibrionales bacterium]